MITGRVRAHEATIRLEVCGPRQRHRPIEAVIDTGYNGYLTLPSRWVTALQLRFAGHRRATLADGSVTVLDVYLASVIWHGRQRDVLVAEAEGSPLVGMSILQGNRMTIDVLEGGEVTIRDLHA